MAALLVLAGCGAGETAAAVAAPDASTAGKAAAVADPDASTAGKAAPLVCAKDAKPVALPDSFPQQASVPAGYVVTAVESRTEGRIVVTAVAAKPFKQTLSEMQAAYSTRGWTPSEGEVEARDAESNFSGHQLRGRWAIREIPECPDNTAVSLLIGK